LQVRQEQQITASQSHDQNNQLLNPEKNITRWSLAHKYQKKNEYDKWICKPAMELTHPYAQTEILNFPALPCRGQVCAVLGVTL
jgi:hypothetical protein